MTNAVTVQGIVDYYVNLLIIQYHNKPKAKAMIDLFVSQLIASGIIFDVRDGYNLETAVGKQLDVIGKYVGVNRTFKAQDLHDFFGLTFYDEVDPDLMDKWGFTNYTNFDTLIENGTLTYNSIILKDFNLSDEDFRVIIKLKIIQNNSNHSYKSINDSMFAFFGNELIPDSDQDMHMYYFVPAAFSQIILAAIIKKVLPKPMGVGLSYITQTDTFFGFSTYDITNPRITGFSEYADYSTKSGEILNYSKISEG